MPPEVRGSMRNSILKFAAAGITRTAAARVKKRRSYKPPRPGNKTISLYPFGPDAASLSFLSVRGPPARAPPLLIYDEMTRMARLQLCENIAGFFFREKNRFIIKFAYNMKGIKI